MPQPPWAAERGVDAVLARWLESSWVSPAFAPTRRSPPPRRPTRRCPRRLGPGVVRALRARGIDRLYAHQARAIEAAFAGRHVVVATPTASGKSLCFHLPVLQALADDPNARAIYLYPTKALARDQEAGLRELDGRRRPRDGAPSSTTATRRPTRGARRASARGSSSRTRTCCTRGSSRTTRPGRARCRHLRYVVVDELHTYRGVFGSHVANVLRRLLRVARFHGSRPCVIGATATIGNPREHAARLFGVAEDDVELVDESGAPRGRAALLPLQPAGRERRARHPRELREAGGDARGRSRARRGADDRLRAVAQHASR